MEWFLSLCADHQGAIVCAMLALLIFFLVVIHDMVIGPKMESISEHWMYEEDK